MKLISQGTKVAQKFKGMCHTCGSVFEADRTELKICPGTQREPGEFAWKKCPVCNTGTETYGGILFYPVK
jgi:rubredoxin